MKRTNSKTVREAVKQHIIEIIYDENENQFKTFEEAAKHLTSEFKRVADHEYNLRRIPNNQDRFKDYLQGLPFHVLYECEAIQTFINTILEADNPKEYKCEDSYQLYTYLIWREMENYYYQ